jgi:arylsulfatase A-like enzyme
MNHTTPETTPPTSTAALLAVAATLGLVTGLGEGAGTQYYAAHGGSLWSIDYASGPEILWVAPLLDGLLFVLAAAIGALAMRAVGRRLTLVPVVGVGVAALADDWMRLSMRSGRLRCALVAAGVGAVAAALAWSAGRGGARGEERTARLVRALARLAPCLACVAIGAFLWNGPFTTWRVHRVEAQLPPPPDGARDVVVVVFDTVRADRLSAYGCARRTSPNLERIAAEGARFDACFATSSWTLPSHASMLTGRLPFEHGAEMTGLDDHCALLPERMVADGWRTGAFSGNLSFFHRRAGFGRGFLCFDDFGWSWRSRFGGTLVGRELLSLAGHRASDRVLRKPARAVTDAFLAWLDESTRPSFAFLNWFDAHDPYLPRPELVRRFDHDGVAPPPMPPLRAGEDRPFDDAQLARDLRDYDACVAALDDELGRLVAELERRGRLDRTILVVLGDHGESFGERGERLHRGSLHQETTRVPLVIRAPGLVAPGTVVDDVTSIASLAATLQELAGARGERLPGASWAPRLAAGGTASELGEHDAVAVMELARHPWPEYRRHPCYRGASAAIVRGRWHFVRHETDGVELYDRVADPREEHDVAALRPDVVAALGKELDATFARLEPHGGRRLSLDELTKRPELGGIGYTGDGH